MYDVVVISYTTVIRGGGRTVQASPEVQVLGVHEDLAQPSLLL